ncbi:peptidoglycan DD-metalloendopeptidase family protein [Sporosarcina sp. resist]|nr:peptidoglycan DD-metalloendopeptidase family protein [Sporosarcina sp. resist]
MAKKMVQRKIVLWLGGLIGISGFGIIVLVMIVVLLIVGIAGGSASQTVNGGGSYCSVTGEVNHDLMDSTLAGAGKLAGTKDMIIQLSSEKGIDPVLFAAIAIHETGYGTSNAIVNKNNPGGLMNPATGSRELYVFDTLEEGLRGMANTLHNRIIKDGLVTIEDLGSVYAPVGAGNDPNGLNGHWVPNVTSIAEELGGLTMNCEQGGDVLIVGDKAWPVPSTKTITSVYGFRTIKVNGVWQSRLHAGVDIAGGNVNGKPIVSYAAGVVTKSQNHAGGWGNHVVIDHGGGVQTLYAHMIEKGVPVGTQVNAGSYLGRVGSTGNSTGPHLHFEVYVNGQTVDPMLYLTPILAGASES